MRWPQSPRRSTPGPDVDYVYTDEDKLAPDGTRYGELLKPDWSPERLRTQNYCTHLSVLRRAIVTDVGGFREGFDGRQDHDLILRVTERARRVHHVPEILYHWCVTPGSAAGDPAAKPHAQALGVRTIGDHLDRVGIDATVQLTENPGNFRVVRRVEDPPTVSVIIPTAGTSREVWGIDRPLIYRCLDSALLGHRVPVDGGRRGPRPEDPRSRRDRDRAVAPPGHRVEDRRRGRRRVQLLTADQPRRRACLGRAARAAQRRRARRAARLAGADGRLHGRTGRRDRRLPPALRRRHAAARWDPVQRAAAAHLPRLRR
ncbi:MAG: hypothetical protein WKF58_10940 [Ilumatobacteraceae bacterium]